MHKSLQATGLTTPNMEATKDECIELSQALEQQRALVIVAAVKALPIGGDTAMSKQFRSGYKLACEEIAYRLQNEEWILLPIPELADREDTGSQPKTPDGKRIVSIKT